MNTFKNFLSKLKKGAGVGERRRSVRTGRRERGNGGGRRREVPSIVRAVQRLCYNLGTGGGVVEIDLANVGPISDGKGKGGGRGRGTELGDDGEGRGHWSMRSASS